MVVLANIVAYLFILTAIGFFAAIAGMAVAGLQFYGQYKRVRAMAERPMNAGMEIYRTGRGIALRDAAHVQAIVASGREAVDQVKAVRADILSAAQSINPEETRQAADDAHDTIASSFATILEGMQFARQVMGIFHQAQKTNGNGHRPQT